MFGYVSFPKTFFTVFLPKTFSTKNFSKLVLSTLLYPSKLFFSSLVIK